MEIHVARHGQTFDNISSVLNHKDDELTDEGINQAKRLGQRLRDKGYTYDAILVSPLIRSQQSAQFMLQEMGVREYTTLHNLRERDFNSAEGLPYGEIPQISNVDLLRTDGATYFLSGGDSETFTALLERAKSVLEEIKSKYPNQKILIVCHGDIGKMLYAAFYGRDLRETLMLFHFGNSEVITLDSTTNFEQVYLNLEA